MVRRSIPFLCCAMPAVDDEILEATHPKDAVVGKRSQPDVDDPESFRRPGAGSRGWVVSRLAGTSNEANDCHLHPCDVPYDVPQLEEEEVLSSLSELDDGHFYDAQAELGPGRNCRRNSATDEALVDQGLGGVVLADQELVGQMVLADQGRGFGRRVVLAGRGLGGCGTKSALCSGVADMLCHPQTDILRHQTVTVSHPSCGL